MWQGNGCNDYILQEQRKWLEKVYNGCHIEIGRKTTNKEAFGSCVNKIYNSSINELVRRATWLGNDETHYIRKWEDRDIHDLKNLIDLTCQYITMESKSKAYLEEMPEKK